MKIELIISIILFFILCQSCRFESDNFVAVSVENYGFPADSIAYSIELAENVWKSATWKKDYKQRDFVHYVVPPSVANEPVEFYWREDIPTWIRIPKDSPDMVRLAQRINKRIDVPVKPETWGNPQMGYSKTMSGAFGKCDDRSILTTMAMRSFGIPASFDYISNWGNTNNGHSFCSVILPGDSLLVFQDKQDDGVHVSYAHKVSKIYRKSYFPNTKGLVYKYYQTEDIPPVLNDIYTVDVTEYHKGGVSDVDLEVGNDNGCKLAYLSVFNPRGWVPVDCAEIKSSGVVFKNVGNGADYDAKSREDNIGKGVLYLPSVYIEKETVPIAAPIVVSSEGIREIKADGGFETVVLTRKYPRFKRVENFASQMVGGIFEVANKIDFSDAVEVAILKNIPQSRPQKLEISLPGSYKYARYRKSSKVFSISELHFYDVAGKEIEGLPLFPNYVDLDTSKNIYDGNPLTYFEISGVIDMWMGYAFNKAEKVGYVGFCPRTDDNDISPGDIYELFYWDNEWKSLGRQFATDYILKYNDVPQGALLWLRNLTKGKEERPFTFEDGKQIWW